MGCRIARNEIVERNLPLVRYVVGRMNLGSSSPLDFDDMVAFGQIGLIDAVERFDHTRGVAFSTYAIRRIRGSIMDELRHMDWAPRSVRSKQRRIERAASELSQANGGLEPSIEEVARRAEMTVEEVEDALDDARRSYTTSLEVETSTYQAPAGTGSDHSTVLADETADPEQHGIMVEHRLRLAGGIARLGEQARTFLALYYFENLSFKEIGTLLGVTESRVCQVHTAAIKELRLTV